MNFSDIFKSKFLEKFSAFSLGDTLLTLAVAFLMGLFILFVYKKTFSGVVYSPSFGLSLLGLTLISTFVILAVTSNVVLSLGMVGALSIVRFRSAIKEPLDIVYLFWSIAVGIVLGAGMIPLAIVGSALLGIMLLSFSALRGKSGSTYLLVFRCEHEQAEQQMMQLVHQQAKKCSVKAKTVTACGVELTLEVSLKQDDTAFVNRLLEIDGAQQANLVSYKGDYGA
ncbi:MAG: DUF4956 domain-containing protein [Clostridia bacterium]|nr:DUF4956 domain-containing protein [Clostridia bacterium]